MNLILRTLLLFTLLIPAVRADQAPEVIFEVTYKGKYGAFTISTVRQLEALADGSFQLTSRASNFLGSLTEVSHFRVEGENWLPMRYHYRRKILGVNAEETLVFDWENMSAAYTHSKKPHLDTTHKLNPGVLDPALYQLRLQRDLLRGEPLFQYEFVKRERIRQYTIIATAEDPLELNKQQFAAIRLERRGGDDDKNTLVWAVPELDFVFARIEHIDDGDSHQMLMNKYRVDRPRFNAFFGLSDSDVTQAQR